MEKKYSENLFKFRICGASSNEAEIDVLYDGARIDTLYVPLDVTFREFFDVDVPAFLENLE